MTIVAITGNTYPVKDQIKALGGRWNADRKAWMVPDDKADAARALVAGAPVSSRPSSSRSGYSSRLRRTGCSCGSVEGRIQRTDCWTCKHDAT